MHLIPTIPGGWNPNEDGVFYIEQSKGDILFLSAADTEIHSLNNAYKEFIENLNTQDLPSLRMTNLTYLKQELTIDKYVEEVVGKAKLVICRLLGGISYYPYLVESIQIECQKKNIPVLFLSGYDVPDLELINLSNVDVSISDLVWKYFCAGGKNNLIELLYFLSYHFFEAKELVYKEPQSIPDLFLYDLKKGILSKEQTSNTLFNTVILVYKSHYLADNLEPVYAIYKQLQEKNIFPIIAFVNNLRDKNTTDELYELLTQPKHSPLSSIINTTSFSIKNITENDNTFIFQKLNIPIIQAIFASCTKTVWENNLFGLPPTDVAINAALPELDGRIITTAISFKTTLGKDAITDSDILKYEAHPEGVDFVVDFAIRWHELQNKINSEKKLALIMPNYPNKDSRLANGVGLDTPESMVRIIKALKENGYDLGNFIPSSSNELIKLITHYITNDVDSTQARPFQVSLKLEDFYEEYESFSPYLKTQLEKQWGKPEDSPFCNNKQFAIPGFLLGNIFISIQPARGYNQDEKAIYHSPDLPPTYNYLAYYFWVNSIFKADAIVHVGKHGNLEWLPGKSIALSKESCYPRVLLNAIPHFYPFIVNDPGEGTQAKRRNQAVILDHLIPPMTRAENYGILTRLEHLIDEYYEAFTLDNKRAGLLKKQIKTLVQEAHLDTDLKTSVDDIDELLVKLDGYLCDLKEAQIRDGLHIFGEVPKNNQLLDLLIALHRLPSGTTKGITQALAIDLELDFNPLECNYADSFKKEIHQVHCRTIGDVVEQLELISRTYLSQFLLDRKKTGYLHFDEVLQSIMNTTYPKIQQTTNEITNLITGLNGKYVPSGSSGAPTRGRLDVLPTGRNFYSIDVRTIPSPTAYTLGVKSAHLIIERYLQENGEYPETIGLSVWGTSTMRTGGDDIAQAFSLMGVKPIWEGANRRVVDFEIISPLILKRPRVDVILRISGFFRDAFPDVISLFNKVIERLAHLDEDPEINPIRKRFLKEKAEWMTKGITHDKAHKRALFRVFGSKPGAYGAGLQAVIDEKNWQTKEDLAKIYMQWSGYAYGNDRIGESAHEVFEQRLSDIQIVMHNQDNREHDLLDSDDYYQFQGGLTNAVQTISGKQPKVYFGDHSRPDNPKVKTLKEELLKVYRSRVVNPKWIEGVKRHGYKGAFEMAATMDYLFAYDATTDMIDDFMYEGITEEYLFNPENKEFIEKVNPWALKDMTERMLEAIQRGMWKNPKSETFEKLQQLFIDIE
ncbi:cobaltochelatase subunit CobN [Flavobacterium covae]|uniref:cobaltochelatase subunit CobN n=1 Tax=Flavobacterium covae TaxID=2906076 RepID=UPI001FB62702|nr:cobaltochelatase subunit CobN [Flavobacterium covae]MCJ1807189.1 cobaltochelatase subunit CobN [Flavobacterium covae]